MVLEFTVENFRSIKDAQTLSFVPDSSTHLRENLLSTDARPDLELLPSLLVYGGNGAGKTNLCRALEAFSWAAVRSSKELTLDEPIDQIQAFRLDPETANKPSRFGMTFLIDGELFEYKLSCTKQRVEEESLRRKANTEKSRWATVFHRLGNERSEWLGNAPRLNYSFFRSVRDNATILSKAAQENIESVYEVFRAIFNIKVKFMSELPPRIVEDVADLVRQHPSVRDQLAPIVACADVRFDEVRLKTEEISGRDLPWEVREYFTPRRSGRAVYHTDLEFMRRGTDGLPVTFTLEDVSFGTIRFLALVLEIFDAAISASLLVLDEFDASLHTLLAHEVRDLLVDAALTSRAGAQYVVVTHNDSLLDSSQLRRDQIVLLNQAADGATEWYAMSELDRLPKPNESFQRRYLLGGYGGVPRIRDIRGVFSDMVREWESSAVQA